MFVYSYPLSNNRKCRIVWDPSKAQMHLADVPENQPDNLPGFPDALMFLTVNFNVTPFESIEQLAEYLRFQKFQLNQDAADQISSWMGNFIHRRASGT
jgi:hypothetical protein